MGRKSAMKMADISSPLPDNKLEIVGLSQLAHIVEDGAEAIYGRQCDSLLELYFAAERIHVRLRRFAEQFGLGLAPIKGQRVIDSDVASLQLHHCKCYIELTLGTYISLTNPKPPVYYHSILLTYRPFLVAESALRSGPRYHQDEQMWLRQACRHAIHAAQDSIVVTTGKLRTSEVCRVS